MIEAGKTYRLRNGLTARITVTDIKGSKRPIGGYISHGDHEEYQTWLENGLIRNFEDSFLDIMVEPECKSRWLNWYVSEYTSSGGIEYTSREEADKNSNICRTHVLEIITEDGEPVDVKIHRVKK